MQTGECDTAIVVRPRQDLRGRAGARAQPAARSLLSGAARPRRRPPPRRCRRAPTWRAPARPTRPRRRRGAQPHRRRAQPRRQVREAATADELRRTPWVVEPLRRGYLPPVGESATCLVLAAEGKAEKLCERPAWIHGVDHRTELQIARRARPVAQRQRRAWRRRRRSRWPGSAARATSTWSSCSPTNPAEELIVLRGARARSRAPTTPVDQSVGRRRSAATRS